MRRFLYLLVIGTLSLPAQPYKLVHVAGDFSSGITCMQALPTGDGVVAGDSAGIIYRVGQTGNVTEKVPAHSQAVRGFAFNSTNRLLLSYAAHDIKIWNAGTLAPMHRLDAQEYADIRFAVFSIADGFIYFNSASRLYKTRSDLSQAVLRLYDFTEPIAGGVITDDRSQLIFVSGNRLRVINTRSDNIIQEMQVTQAAVEHLALLPGSRLATWSADGTVSVWKISFGQVEVMPLLRFKAGFSSPMAFSANGETMASGRIGTWARIWDWPNRSIRQELFGHSGTVTSTAFLAGDDLLFTASEDKTLRIWSRRDTVEYKPPQPKPTPPPAPQPEVVKPQPLVVNDRAVVPTEAFEMTGDTVELFIYDNSALDGDVISLSFNGDWILKNYEVLRTKKRIVLKLQKGNNYLVMYAENLGKTPPNTAVAEFIYNTRKKIIRLKSDLKSSSALNFLYK